MKHGTLAAVMGPFEAAIGTRYFGYGRSALLEGFRLLGVGDGDKVLLPGYICREVLAPIAACGAEAMFYEVNTALEPAQPWTQWPAAKAVLAVNYFGFPQPLEPFKQYCAKHHAFLVEDNAHGFLGRELDGEWLGLRGDVGIFSMRKTARLVDGAALTVMQPQLAAALSAQLRPRLAARSLKQAVETVLSRLPTSRPLAWAKSARRSMRRWNTGHAAPLSDAAQEYRMPADAAPHAGLLTALRRLDRNAEMTRRCQLFEQIHERLAPFGVSPVYASVPSGVVPYGYAFRGGDMDGAMDAAWGLGLDAFVWPALPASIAPIAPSHYVQTGLVNFL